MSNIEDNTHLRRELVTAAGNLYIEYRATRYVLKHYNGDGKWAVNLHEARKAPNFLHRRDELFGAIQANLENILSESEFLSVLQNAIQEGLSDVS